MWQCVPAMYIFVGQVCYQSFDVNNPLTEPAFSVVNNFINANQNVSFVGTWMLVMEWKDVHPNPHSILEQYDISSQKILNRVRITADAWY